jgi:hypothetical protein
MKPIQYPPPPDIGPESNSDAVANLQDALLFLLVKGRIDLTDEIRDALRRERGERAYDGGTMRAVIAFREQLGLEPGEIVDEPTAEALNRLLEDVGAFEQPGQAIERPRLISGRVARDDGQPFAAGRVRAFHEDERGAIRLGEDTTDAEGRYTIRYDPLPGVSVVNTSVSALDESGRTVASSDVMRNAGPVQVIDLVVPVVQPSATARRVEGRIVFDHGAPAEDMTLRLYRLGFGGAEAATLLAERPILAHGVYSLAYPADGEPANLEVRALDAAGNEVTLSKLIRNAGERETLNLVAPAAAKPLAAEFKRITGDLLPHIGDLGQLKRARETAEQQDMTLLHEATGWDARLIVTATLAARLSAPEETGLPQEALYGLLRVGLPSDKLQLAQVSPEAFDQALSKARTAGIVQIDEADVPQLKKDFETFNINTRLAVQVPGSQATYGDMLAKLDLVEDENTLAKKNTFAKLYLNHRGDAKSLWKEAEEAGLQEIVPKLQRQGKLAFLTTNNPELTQKLQTDLGDAGPEQLVQMGLYKKEKWVERIDVVPAAYAHTPNPKIAYAEDMARRVRISYSTEVTWHMIETGELVIEGGNENLSAVLRKAIDNGFKLGQSAIDPFLKANQEVFEGLSDADRRITTEMIKTLQRVYQITPGNDAMKALLDAGLLSAQDVLAYPLDAFLERFVSSKFPEEQALLVYRKAEQVSNITYSLFSLAKELESAPPVFAMSGAPEVRKAERDDLVKRFPTMESLFGSLDYCECEECRSVLSPAAYLVDLLQFLDREPLIWQNTLKHWKAKHGDTPYPFRNSDAFKRFLERWHAAHPGEPDPATERTPYDVLTERRPDLPHISLTCENTNTALPQIDLVNEILEYYVAKNGLTADAARDTGDATTGELLAEPQYVISKAYSTLQQARYPLTLPFDLWIETVRTFSAYFDTPLWQLLETFRKRDDLLAPTEPYDRAAVFFESLGLSPSEVAIFTDPDPLGAWFTLYGFATEEEALTEDYDAAGHRIDLSSAKALSRRLGVTYQELVAIVQTAFVNPELADLALLYKLGVTITDARFYADHKPYYDKNQNLVGKRRDDLEPTDKQRFDALVRKPEGSQLTGWDIVNEVAGFEHRLGKLATTFNTPLKDLQAAVQALTFDKVLVLADADAGCNFDQTRLRYADGTPVDGIALLRMNLFVRLWRKLGWSIEEIDHALTTFVPKSAPFDDNGANLAEQPLKTALIYLAHLQALDQTVKVGKQSRLKLLTLWSNLPTTGKQSLYAQLFLTHSARKSAEVEVIVPGEPEPWHLSVFDDPLGRYLEPAQVAQLADQVRYEVRLPGVTGVDQINEAAFAGEERIGLRHDDLGEVQYLTYIGILTDAEKDRLADLAPSDTLSKLLDAVQARAAEFQLIKGHLLTLQGALGLTVGEIGAILTDAGISLDEADLTLPNVSTLYRYGLLAKALGLSVAELIALKQLSGLDPVKLLDKHPLKTIEQDYPFSQTLGFVQLAEAVQESGLKVEDLDYLLRHRVDETGKYRPNREARLAWLKTLAEGIQAIRVDQAIPDDPGALSEDMLRQKLGLVLPADVVEHFLALMNGTAETTAALDVASANKLTPADFGGHPTIRVLPYNGAKGQQSLVLRGDPSEAQRDNLKDRFNDKLAGGQQAVFAKLLDAVLDTVTAKSTEFFDRNLKKQPANVSPTRGFLDKEQFNQLLAPLPVIDDNLPAKEAEAARKTNEDLRRQKLTTLADAFFPYLQQRLVRQFLVQQVIGYTTADPTLVESLLTDARLLSTGDVAPLLTAFEALGARGVSAAFYDSPDLKGEAQKTSPVIASADTGHNALNSAKSAHFEGGLSVSTPGAYRFTIELEKEGAIAELRFEHLPDPEFLSGVAGGNKATLGNEEAQFLELKPGIVYRFTLTLKNLAGGRARVLVEGETLPKDDLSQLALYPASVLDGAERAFLLLSKALQIVQLLELSEREVRYLLTQNDGDFADLDLRKLAWRDALQVLGTIAHEKREATPNLTIEEAMEEARNENPDLAAEADQATPLFNQFLRLAAYTRLKRDLVGDTDDLIGVFEANGTGDLDGAVYPLIARLARRDEETVKSTARALADAPSFGSEQPLERLWGALQVVERFGVPVASLLEWTRIVSQKASATQRAEIARDLKEAIKARFEPETWLRIAQPIFDKLRQRQRDALVFHVMQQHGFDRIEQLFELFLIDPGVEPVVQTSRIRSAIAAVQIFIHRCLLNLEPGVDASAINSKQWQWMKRYPVWAGNRKLWLFPENVLEPEFRDDKTHLFTELEGKLLQSDVSNDVAEDAFFTYLKKLEELARLEIVAMYCEEQPLDPASNQLHVIGRNYLEGHRYFYRRYAHEMWTPWEPMQVDIEGNHIVPVVWRDRFNLFWVTFIDNPDLDAGLSDEATFEALMTQDVRLTKFRGGAADREASMTQGVSVAEVLGVAPSKESPSSKKLTELSLGQLAGGARSAMLTKVVKVQLHWSEYFHGEWSVRESGGYSASLVKTVPLDFDPATVFIHATKELDPQDGAERAVRIHLGGVINQAFRVVSRNSRPTRVSPAGPPPPMPYTAKVQANRYRGSGAFKVTFTQRIETEVGKPPKTTPATPSILQDGEGFTLVPCANTIGLGTPEIASLVSPLFYQDDRSNTFFVEPTLKEKTIEEWQEWVTRVPQPEVEWDRPDWWDKLDIKPLVPRLNLPIPVNPDDPIWQTRVDPRARFELAPREDWLANPQTLVQFDGELVGPAGRAGLAIQPSAEVGAARDGAVPAITVNAGSAIAADRSIVAVDEVALSASGLSRDGTGLNVIGGTGLNSALLKNLNKTKGF